jgi:hypothetical protein
MDKGNDQTQAEQRGAPGGEAAQEAQRSWVSALASDANQVGVGLATMAAAYGAKLAVDKIRKPPEPPPPSGSDGEA